MPREDNYPEDRPSIPQAGSSQQDRRRGHGNRDSLGGGWRLQEHVPRECVQGGVWLLALHPALCRPSQTLELPKSPKAPPLQPMGSQLSNTLLIPE